MTTPRRFHRLRAVLDRRQPDLTVLLEGVHKPHNLSAVLRTCDAVGVFEAHAITPDGGLPELNEAVTQGTGKWVGLRSYPDLYAAFDELRGRGMQVLAAHPGGDAVDFRDADFTPPTAVLLGQERDGLTTAAAARADRLIAVPMMGMVASLNVSVAAALILFEAQRQRVAAGLYDRSRLDAEVYRRTLFEWAYPLLAERCHRYGMPYPPLDDEGDLLGPVPR
jgi:tRNA (guanosine-2'-O-)-methyltransferase